MGGTIWEMTRRSFIRWLASVGAASVAGILTAGAGVARAAAAASGRVRRLGRPESMTPLEREHMPRIQMPHHAEDGAEVPIIIDMDHDQRPGDYIESIEIFKFSDPVPNKGIYHFTPAAGRVHLSVRLRMDRGRSKVFVFVNCTKHGRFRISRPIQVDKGGC